LRRRGNKVSKESRLSRKKGGPVQQTESGRAKRQNDAVLPFRKILLSLNATWKKEQRGGEMEGYACCSMCRGKAREV